MVRKGGGFVKERVFFVRCGLYLVKMGLLFGEFSFLFGKVWVFFPGRFGVFFGKIFWWGFLVKKWVCFVRFVLCLILMQV